MYIIILSPRIHICWEFFIWSHTVKISKIVRTFVTKFQIIGVAQANMARNNWLLDVNEYN
jgi:hypothetical protein